VALVASTLKTLPPGEKKPGKKDAGKKHFDSQGLYLLVKQSGVETKRYWRLKYYFGGRELLLSLGMYPPVSLAEARRLRDEARAQIRRGVDPSAAKRAAGASETFLTVAEDFLAKQLAGAAERTASKRRWLLLKLAPLHNRRLTDITTRDILNVLERIEKQGKHETAHRCASLVSRVFRFSQAKGLIQANPAEGLKGALAPVVVEKHAGLTDPRLFSALLQATDAYQGSPVVRAALRLLPYVFLRSSEIRGSTWDEIDWTRKVWRIAAPRMKMRGEHTVPLAPPVIKMLEELRAITGPTGLMFPSATDPGRPLSDMSLTMALRRMGIPPTAHTVHGYRTSAATLIRERGFGTDELIEKQLAHRDRNRTRSAYDQSTMLKARREMMTKWAEFVEDLASPTWLQILQHAEN
jgi:integrase